MKSKLLLLVLTTVMVSISQLVSADVEGTEARPFNLLLKTAPLVVIGRMTDVADIRVSKTADSDSNRAEVYTYYEIEADRILKGELPDRVLQIRTLGGSAKGFYSKAALTFQPDQSVLLLLSPDYGLDPETGKPRESYLVLYQSKYPVIGNTVQINNTKSAKNPQIQEIIARLKADEQRKSKRLEQGEPDWIKSETIENTAADNYEKVLPSTENDSLPNEQISRESDNSEPIDVDRPSFSQ